MAAGLLIGTNSWAAVSNWNDLSSEIDAAEANVLKTITLGANISMPSGAVLLVNGNKNIELNLAGFNITEPADVYYPIQVIGGKLTIKGNGTIAATSDAILKVEGSATDVANYSVLNVEYGVRMTSTGEYGVVVRQAGSTKHSYGVVINFDGYVKVEHASGTAFWILGNIKDTEGNIPQITIGPHAELIGATDGVGYYAGGYAENTIQGSISGGAGIYAKAGEITIDGGHITATSQDYSAPSNNTNGFTGGMGCAIVSDSNKGYAGDMNITITGDAELNTNAVEGYAIKETITNANQTLTESLVIESGTINGDLSTTAELHDNIVLNGTITGGTYSGNISDYIDPAATDLVETEPNSGVYTVKVAVEVKLNSFGYATFSAKKNVVLPAGVSAYIAQSFSGNNLYCGDAVATEGEVIPANNGVILVGAANAEPKLEETTTAATDFSGNLLKPATAWDKNVHPGEAYILHENELWVYDGEEFKANKAFLPKSALSGAPARIRLVFNGATGVENVEVEAVKAEKFYENGQLFIRRGAEVYNVQGQLVK